MLEYKGYVAAIEYDESVDELFAYVSNSGNYPVASCYASDVEGLKREFQISIDVYLDGCLEFGIEPITPTPIPSEATS